MESPTLLVVDRPWYDGHVPESLRNEHGKDWSSTWHVVHNMANRVESAEERQERLRRRRERYRIRRKRETDEERESSANGL